MIETASGLRRLVSDVTAELVPLATLDSEVANLSETLDDSSDPSLAALTARLELVLAEYTSGALDEDEFGWELRQIAPTVIDLRATTGMTLRFIADSMGSIVRSPVVRSAVLPSPAAGRQPAAVLAS